VGQLCITLTIQEQAMSSVTGPVVPRRRLAAELRRLRAEAGLTLDAVADELMISRSKLSRLEKGQGSPQGRDVRDLIRLYGIEGSELSETMMRWVRAARRQGWWNDYSYTSSGAMTGMDAHIAYESEASVARVYTIPFLPALLQTPDYARALYQSMEPWRDRAEIDQLVQLRSGRQRLLTDRDDAPLQLIAISHECCLRQVVGSTTIMREQLRALDASFERANIDLRILPFSAPPTFTSTCMFAYFEFGDALDRDVVHVETHAGFRYIESTEQVAQYRRHYDDLMRRALPPIASRQLLRSAAQAW
jgi:transcriptional regulator with XRE-family HTH domain